MDQNPEPSIGNSDQSPEGNGVPSRPPSSPPAQPKIAPQSPTLEQQLQLYKKRGINPNPWIAAYDKRYVSVLGYQDPFHYVKLQDWMELLREKFLLQNESEFSIRRRFVKPRCVGCGHFCNRDGPCPDMPLALPCGHIIGYNCLSNLYQRFLDHNMLAYAHCPWRGPGPDGPPTWSPACTTRIFHRCPHPLMYLELPPATEAFYLPDSFFCSRINGYMPKECRRCSVATHLKEMTREIRGKYRQDSTFASCSGIDGLLEGERRVLQARPKIGLEEHAAGASDLIKDFLDHTPSVPEPGRPLRPEVHFLKPCITYGKRKAPSLCPAATPKTGDRPGTPAV